MIITSTLVDAIMLTRENLATSTLALQVRTSDLTFLGCFCEKVNSVYGETILELFAVHTICGLLVHELFHADMNLRSISASEDS